MRVPRVFAARMERIADARDFVASFGRDNGIADDDVLRMELVVEELFTNTVQHGYGRECDEPIRIALDMRGGIVTIRYEDAAHACDPLATLEESRAALSAPVEAREPRGLGVPLIAGLTDEARYSFEAGRNCLRLSMRVMLQTPCAVS
jgi:anti-sigma regulatory factor (Ser/Thr protein kinase)